MPTQYVIAVAVQLNRVNARNIRLRWNLGCKLSEGGDYDYAMAAERFRLRRLRSRYVHARRGLHGQERGVGAGMGRTSQTMAPARAWARNPLHRMSRGAHRPHADGQRFH